MTIPTKIEDSIQLLLKGLDGNLDKILPPAPKPETDGKQRSAELSKQDRIIIIAGIFKTCCQEIGPVSGESIEVFEKAPCATVDHIVKLRNDIEAFLNNISVIDRIARSQLGIILLKNDPTIDVTSINPSKLRAGHLLEALKILQSLLKEDVEFPKIWGSIDAAQQAEATHHLADFIEKGHNRELLKDSVPLLVDMQKFKRTIREFSVYNFMYHIFPFFFNQSKATAPEAAQLIREYFDVITKQDGIDRRKAHEFGSHIFSDSFEKKIYSCKQVAKYLKGFRAMCAKAKDDPEIFRRGVLRVEYLSLFEKGSVLYSRMCERYEARFSYRRLNDPLWEHYRQASSNLMTHFELFAQHASVEGCHAFLDILDFLGQDGMYALGSLFMHYPPTKALRGLTKEYIEATQHFLIWLRSETQKADCQKERIGNLLDRFVLMVIAGPLAKNVILRLPKDRYDLLEKVLNIKDDIVGITQEEVSKVLTGAGEEKLAVSMFDDVDRREKLFAKISSFFGQNPHVERAANDFLNQVLFIRKGKLPDANVTFVEKCKTIPEFYIRTLEQFLIMARNDPEALHQMLVFAVRNPYYNPLNYFCHNVWSYVNTHSEQAQKGGLALSLQGINLLAEEFPQLIPHQKIPLQFIQGYMELRKANRELLVAILKAQPSWINNECLSRIAGDPVLQQCLSKLIESDTKNDTQLLEIIGGNLSLLKENPLLFTALEQHPRLGNSLCQFFMDRMLKLKGQRTIFTDDSKKTFVDWLELLKHDGPYAIQLILHADHYYFGVNCVLKGYKKGIRIDFSAFERSNDLRRLICVIDMMLEESLEFPRKLALLYKENPELAHRLLDMAYANYHAEAARILQLSEPKPNDPFTHRLLSLAGSKNAPLLARALETRGDLQKVFVNGDTQLFGQLLLLQARGQEKLQKIVLDLYLKLAPQPFEKVVLKAAEEGAFALAKTILENRDKMPFLDRSLAVMQKWQDLLADIATLKQMKAPEDLAKQIESQLGAFVQGCQDDKQVIACIGKVQFLLMHKPEQLSKILSLPNWHTTLDIEKEITEILGVSSKSEADEKAGQAITLSQLLQSYGACLISAGGRINRELIQHFVRHFAATRYASEPYVGDYVVRILHTFANPEYSERLTELGQSEPVPILDREFDKIFQAHKNKPLHLRLKMALLTSMLWPIRQDGVRSCFATSKLINLMNDPQGLLQVFEDMMTLFSKGYIHRKQVNNKNAVRFPLIAPEVDGHNDFTLARYYEYTLSSLFTVDGNYYQLRSSILQRTLGIWGKIFHRPLDGDYYGAQMARTFGKSVTDTLLANVERACVEVFNGFAKNPSQKSRGAWQIVDKVSGVPLNSYERVVKFFEKMFRLLKAQIKIQSPESTADSKELDAFLDVRAGQFLKTDDFIRPSLHLVKREDQKGLAYINPFKYHRLLNVAFLEQFEGSNLKNLVETFHSQKAREGYSSCATNPYESYHNFLLSLTDEELEMARSNPHQLMLTRVPSHALNFKVSQAFTLFAKETPDALWEYERKSYSAIEAQVLSPDDKRKIIESFLGSFHKSYQGELRHALEPHLKACATVRELCDALATVERRVFAHVEEYTAAGDVVEMELRKLPQLQGKFPKVHWLLDTNWTETQSMAYGYRIYNRSVQRVFPDKAGDSILPVRWVPGRIENMEFCRYCTSLNPFERTYFTP